MANIYQIAEEVGLSPSTVARALRGTGYCSKENLEKIMAAAEKFNYVPSHAAKTLKSKRTYKVLFCIPDIYNPFYFRMIKGATDVLDQHGYYPILCHTRGEKEMELMMLRNLSEGYGDGMIFVSFDFNEENIEAVNRCGKPVVLTNRFGHCVSMHIGIGSAQLLASVMRAWRIAISALGEKIPRERATIVF